MQTILRCLLVFTTFNLPFCIAAYAEENLNQITDMEEYRKVVLHSPRSRGQSTLILERLGEKKKVNISKINQLKKDGGKKSLQDLSRD